MLSNPQFGFKTRALDVARGFREEIGGRVVVITGVSPNSIGSGLAHALASQSPSLLILASRTPKNIKVVITSIQALYPFVAIKAVTLDLSCQQSVRSAAADIEKILGERRGGGIIDVLFNNAGINISWREVTQEGWELQFATNYLGSWLFTSLLMPFILASAPSNSSQSSPIPMFNKRIINTSSEAHRISPIRFSDLHQTPGAEVPDVEKPRRGMPEGILRGGGAYEPVIAYGMSKSANILFGVELNKRFAGKGVGSWAVSPGNIMTGLVRGADEKMLNGMLSGIPDSEWKTVDQGAATLVIAGFDPQLEVSDGVYLHDCQIKRPSRWASDPVVAERLWKVSEELIGEKFDEEVLKNIGQGKNKASRL